MRNVPRWLVAIDLHREGTTLTAGSCLATDQAVELAKQGDAEVVLLHSIGPDRVESRCRGRFDTRDSAQHTLDQVADRFRAIGVAASVAISDDLPWLAIVRRVIRDRIDLVFAGRRNESSQLPMGLGSVSRQLVRKCPSAVWVAKPGGDLAPRRVLAASDLSPVGERVVEYAAFVAAHYGAELHVVHAFGLRRGTELEGWVGMEELVRREHEARVRRLGEQVARAGRAPATSIHAVREAPSKAILDLCAQLEPDLVVMGTVSRSRVHGLLVGKTAIRLLGRLGCSLLTVKPDDFVCPVALED